MRLQQSLAAEEIGRIVHSTQESPFLLFGHRSQLLHIAYHQYLHTTKGAAVSAVTAEIVADCVQQVGTYHTYFVDDQEIKTTDKINFFFAQFMALLSAPGRYFAFGAGNVRAKRQLKKGMDGHSAGIDGSNSGGSQHHRAFVKLFFEPLQKSGFPCSGFTGQKNMFAGTTYIIIGQLQAGIAPDYLFLLLYMLRTART